MQKIIEYEFEVKVTKKAKINITYNQVPHLPQATIL